MTLALHGCDAPLYVLAHIKHPSTHHVYVELYSGFEHVCGVAYPSYHKLFKILIT